VHYMVRPCTAPTVWCISKPVCALQSIDDQIMCLVGMGFELEDCQSAVENGKLSVNEAVEWSVLYCMQLVLFLHCLGKLFWNIKTLVIFNVF